MVAKAGALARTVRRLVGIFGVGARRVFGRQGGRGRTVVTVLSVALAIGTMLVIGGIAVGMATQGTVPADDVSYAVLPDAVDQDSPLAAFDNPQFGAAHDAAEQMRDHEHVRGASPVLVHLSSLETADGDRTRALFLGIGVDENVTSVAGLPTGELDATQPYRQANRSASAWTGEAVLSPGAAQVLGHDVGDALEGTDGPENFTVTAIADEEAAGALAGTPVILVHLTELQTAVGLAEHDQAHQFVVEADSTAAESHLESIYPQSTVSTQTGIAIGAVSAGGMPTAMLGVAVFVSVVVGTLFLVTAMGLEVSADARQLGTLAAMGLTVGSRFAMIAAQTLLIAIAGELIGVALAVLGTAAVNWALLAFGLGTPVAIFEPWLASVGLAVAGFIGLISLPYLALLIRRLDSREALR